MADGSSQGVQPEHGRDLTPVTEQARIVSHHAAGTGGLFQPDDFDEAGAAFERRDATTRTGAVGQARATLLLVRPLVDFAAHWFKRRRNAAD